VAGSPMGSRRRLGAELRRLRQARGLTLDEVAERMTCSTSKISRLETGKGIPKVPDVNELLRIYGVGSDEDRAVLLRLVHHGREHGWWEPLTDGVQPDRFVIDAPGRYEALENDAVAVRAFEVAMFHGLLQTEEYTRLVLGSLLQAEHDPAEIDRMVQLRQRRQRALHDPGRGLELQLVVDEAVLHRAAGSPAATVAQLEHVLACAELPNVTVQVLPFSAGLHRVHAGAFTVLEFAGDGLADVVYIEGPGRETYLEAPSDVVLYKSVLADAGRRALDPRASRALIGRYLTKHAQS
jgi:transcriptional regulator with XRE-family HTH domain